LQLSDGLINGEFHYHGNIQFGLQPVAVCFAVGHFFLQRCKAIFLAVELFGVPQ